MPFHSFHSPIGDLTLFEEEEKLIAIEDGWASSDEETSLLRAAKEQILAYLGGERREFDFPFLLSGTEHQNRVWREIAQISYGKTRTYGEIAKKINSSPRAVGGACGANPLPLLIPCHRVVSRQEGGEIKGGYSFMAGPETKNFLLSLESHFLRN